MWWSQARCRGMPTETFFIADYEVGRSRMVREMRAKSICRSCPVSEPCGVYALTTGERHGVWGALTPRERDNLGGLFEGDGGGHRRALTDGAADIESAAERFYPVDEPNQSRAV